ncbi:DEAD/DEAH box helicase [Hoyosella rhizosphaerae]|uniref:DEAD/DEAH box helicase n=1 Tax=Hoyosella rhizosphaerae TaxID=1755582 RepID=UPI0027DC5373|nr:DEAD/DEAH box helicase [Hoyosella rhizosphaerae]
MLPEQLRYVVPGSLRPIVGEATFWRGMAYARDGAVRDLTWDIAANVLRANVDGSGRNSYDTVVAFTTGGGEWEFDFGRCSCPVSRNCKHSVAVLATAVTAASADGGHVAPLADWERTLASLTPDAPAPAEPALGLEFSLAELTKIQQRAGETGSRLLVRLATHGRRGWVTTGITWSELPYAHYRTDTPPEHVHILRELFAIYQAGRGQAHYVNSLDGQMDLGEFHSPRLWAVLRDADCHGLPLLDRARNWRPVTLHDNITWNLDVTNSGSAGLSLRGVFSIDKSSTAVTFLGKPTHGIAVTDDLGCLHLAALQRPIPDTFKPMFTGGTEVRIPASDSARFVTDYFPQLRSYTDIVSTDGSFKRPVISGPELGVSVVFSPDYRSTLTLSWRYFVDDSASNFRFGDNTSGAQLRIRHEEMAITDHVASCLNGLIPRDGVAETMSFNAITTVNFITEVLPELKQHPGIKVTIVGEEPDFHDANDAVTITLATAHLTGQSDWFDLNVALTVGTTVVSFPDVFRALDGGESHMVLPTGAFFSLDNPELTKLRNLITEAKMLDDSPGDDAQDRLRINRYQATLWEELVGLGVVTDQAAEWSRQVDGLLNYNPVDIPPPPRLHATLRPYQHDGYSWLTFLWEHRLGGILADDMGLGKTIQTLAMISQARTTNPGGPPFLIVAPTSVVPNWAHEAYRFTPDLTVVTLSDTLKKRGANLADTIAGADIVVTSYTLFRLDFDAHEANTWSALFLDEAQMAKNQRSKIYQCCRRLPAPMKVAITGTPIENNLMELWALLSITAPGLFPNPKQFKQLYAEPIEKLGDKELLHQLKRRIAPLVRRRTKEMVADDLPPKQEQVLEIDLHPKHRKAYETQLQNERRKILGLVDDIDKHRITILRSLTTLRQLALHAGLVDDTHASVPSAKIDALLEHLEDVVAGGHRALVFSQFTGFLRLVRDRLMYDGISYSYLDGSTRNRAEVIDGFKNGSAPVFLISLKAGGFGLNLTEADYVFILDPWWNPATEAQAVDRTHRIGQNRNVMVYRLLSHNTIEQKVNALQQRKAQLSSSVLDDGTTFGSTLTADDIRGLFD